MTLNDVKNEVAALGFEREMEADAGFLSAVNRALNQIYIERPLEKIMTFYPKSLKSSLYEKEILHTGGVQSTVSGEGLAIAFRSYGTGKLELTDDMGKRTFEFNGEGSLTSAFIRGKATLKFVGEFCYTVQDLTIYSSLLSDDLDDVVPLYDTVFFNPLKYDKCFIGFSSYPYDKDGLPVERSVIDSRGVGIKLPYNGVISINYRVKPKRLGADDLDEEIEMPEGSEHLLALLAAHYVWLDDDFTKAQHYYGLYREGMNALKYFLRGMESTKYTTNGWA